MDGCANEGVLAVDGWAGGFAVGGFAAGGGGGGRGGWWMSGLVMRHLASLHRFLDSRQSLRIACRSSARRLRWPSRSSFRVAASAVVVNQNRSGAARRKYASVELYRRPRGVDRLRLRKGTTTSSTARGRSSGARRANERSVLFRTSADFLVLRVKKYPRINQPYLAPSRLARREKNVYGVVVEESEGGGLNKKKKTGLGVIRFTLRCPSRGIKV